MSMEKKMSKIAFTTNTKYLHKGVIHENRGSNH